MLATLENLVPLLLAISLASERLIAILKAIFPALAIEKKNGDTGEEDPNADRGRRLMVQLLAIGTSWVTVSLAFNSWNPTTAITINGTSFSLAALALLGSGGSAMWNNVLGYVKAAKDVRIGEKESASVARQMDLAGRDAVKIGANPPAFAPQTP